MIDQQEKQYEAQVAGLKAQKSYLEVLLKAANEQRTYITPLTKHALFLGNKIYQMHVQIAGEVFKVKQVEDRLQEISATATEFKDKTQDIVEVIQGQLAWLETTKEPLENTPVKAPKRL